MCCCGRICRWLLTGAFLFLLFLVGGYAGKYIYMISIQHTDPNLWDLIQMHFWKPDKAFWVSGAIVVGGLLLVYFVCALFFKGVGNCFKTYMRDDKLGVTLDDERELPDNELAFSPFKLNGSDAGNHSRYVHLNEV